MAAVIPLTDPSEARYAEIARVMATSGDWVTPWFAPDVPFWGKPPASFWAQAVGIKLFGVNEFAVRAAAVLAFGLTLWILFRFVSELKGKAVARNSVLIYASTLLPFIMAGAVLTDPYLVLATTWIMASVWLSKTSDRWYWRYGLFLGTALGMLAKGPLVLVLTGGALAPWFFFSGEGRNFLRRQPWLSGTALALLICVPWYWLAELKTPGFLHYFLVGEHFLRFVKPGWGGDLYGGAHDHAKGTIWLYFVGASFPWGFWLLYRAFTLLRKQARDNRLNHVWNAQALGQWWRQPLVLYLSGWVLFTPVFFTVSGNILWTYVLPAMPAFSVVVASLLSTRDSTREQSVQPGLLTRGMSLAVPVMMVIAIIAVNVKPTLLKTEKVAANYIEQATAGRLAGQAAFLGKPTSSMMFYTAGNMESMPLKALPSCGSDVAAMPALVAVRQREVREVAGTLGNCYQPILKTREVSLYRYRDAGDLVQKTAPGANGEG